MAVGAIQIMKSKFKTIRLAINMAGLGLAGVLAAPALADAPTDTVNSILRSEAQATNVPVGQTVAMVCTKCKTVLISDAKTKKGFLGWFQANARHECPGCGGEFTMKSVPAGQGTVSLAEYVHTCSKCGDESAFCCAASASGTATKGMKKEKP